MTTISLPIHSCEIPFQLYGMGTTMWSAEGTRRQNEAPSGPDSGVGMSQQTRPLATDLHAEKTPQIFPRCIKER